LQRSIGVLVEAKDIEGARTAFQSVSADLIRALDVASK
jgi:hypothetical protein